jgi:hemolysin activation/secretion protein
MSDVIITRQRGKPWTAAFSWDDSGQPSTGVQQGNATLGIDNVIGINDALSLSWSQELGQLTDPRTRSDTLSWVLPWGNWTGMASYSESAYHQLIQGAISCWFPVATVVTPSCRSPASSTGISSAKPSWPCN